MKIDDGLWLQKSSAERLRGGTHYFYLSLNFRISNHST
jgi:hypothetical protein